MQYFCLHVHCIFQSEFPSRNTLEYILTVFKPQHLVLNNWQAQCDLVILNLLISNTFKLTTLQNVIVKVLLNHLQLNEIVVCSFLLSQLLIIIYMIIIYPVYLTVFIFNN